MALLFIDSFDHYVTADITEKWTVQTTAFNGTFSIGATAGRRSSGGLRLGTAAGNGPTTYVQKTIAGGDATFVMGFAFTVPTGVPGAKGLTIATVLDGATQQVSLRLNADYTLSVLRGPNSNSPTVLGTTPGALTAAVFNYLEWQVLIHPSAGTLTVRVNGASVLALTAQNTRASGASQWTAAVLGDPEGVITSTTIGTFNWDYDDFYLLDGTGVAPWNTFLGDCRVDALYPTAPGATTGWTPSAGANWQCVDETAPNDDTDYTAAATAALTDTFIVQDAPVVSAAIFGVQHCLNMKKTDAGVATIAPVIRMSGTDYLGAGLAPGTGYAFGVAPAATNPATGAAWTEAGFNAAEFGYKRTT